LGEEYIVAEDSRHTRKKDSLLTCSKERGDSYHYSDWLELGRIPQWSHNDRSCLWLDRNGSLFLQALAGDVPDLPIVIGSTYLLTLVFVITVLVTDIIYARFDPRISAG
jgi:hypothetical protein